MKSATISSQKFINKFSLALLAGLTFLSTLLKAQTPDTLWTEKWERTNWTNDWHVDAGTWEVGKPTSGPGKAYRGQNCAATVLGGNYSEPVDSRLIRHTSFVVPPASQNPRLRFWHWYSFSAGDNGKVQISTNGGSSWIDISETYANTSSSVWTYPSIDLSAYSGMSAQIAFYFHSQPVGAFGDVSAGWYIDEVALIAGAKVFNNPEGWESGIGSWYVDKGTWEVGDPTGSAHSGQNCAATVLNGNYAEPIDSRLISPPYVVPSASQNPRLRFWHWYSFSAGDYGEVQIRIGNGAWQKLSESYVNTGSNVWTYPFLDLRAYAGSTVQFAFYFHSQAVGAFGDVSLGWYIDDLAVVTGASVFNNPEGWESGIGDWYVDKGTWEVGDPTGNAHSGQNCAATVLNGNYAEPVDARLISPPYVVPSASQNPRLRFWHSYSFSAGDYGEVQIRIGNGAWQKLSESYVNTGSNVWTYPFLDLRAYAGSTVQFAFYFHSQAVGAFGDVSLGWYVDDLAVVTGAIVFNNPEGWESGIGDWYVDMGTWEVGTPDGGACIGQMSASTVLRGNYAEPVVSRLISPQFVVPSLTQNPSIGFWHRYNFSAGDTGFVQIRVGKGKWQTILGPYVGTSSGSCTPPFKSLSSYADSTVQLAFYFKSRPIGAFGDVATGWDVDEIKINGLTSCVFSIFPTSNSFPPSGGAGSVNVTANTGCQWAAVSNVNWIKITSGSSGSGNGTVNYSVDPNTGTNSRNGTITVTGQNFTGTHTVTQGVNGSTITIIAPNGGENWAVDSVQTIRWSSSNLTGNVKIEFSINAGQTWLSIASNTPNVGSFAWTPTQLTPDLCRIGIMSERCLIRISSVSNNSIFDQSDAFFSVLRKGDVNFDGVVNEIDMQMIRDIFLGIIDPTPSQFWAADCNGNNQVDSADIVRARNKLLECAKIKIISPNGGEIWPVGVRQTITWDPSIVSSNVRIELSKDSGKSWSMLDTNRVNTGSYFWTPTENHVSNSCLMRITSVSGISDTSDAVFAITKGVITFRRLFNTGVDSNGVVLPVGFKEMHYSLTGPLSPAMVISPLTSPPEFAWVTPPTGSAWIGPTESNITDHPGLYVYTLKFELTGFDPSTAFITGDAAADNTLAIFLNGVDTGLAFPDQFYALKAFTIDKGFVSGMNTLEFKVTNLPPNGLNPTGLLIANLKGQAKPINVVRIFPIAASPQFATQEFWVDVKVGDSASPVTNLFGASFCLTFTNTNFIDLVTPYASTVIPGDFLGSDVVFQSNVDETAGKVCIGISRKAGQGGVSGNGTLARIKVIANSTTPDKTQIQFCVTEVIANDPNGNSISLTPVCPTVTINKCLTVWPGDTNNDGKVDQVDVLPIGLYWGRTGSVCASPSSCAWSARCCTPWTPLAATYAEANGDGVVNQVDVLCLGLNWNKTHTTNFSLVFGAPLEKAGSVVSASLAPEVKPVQAPNQEFFVRLKASEVSNLFGLSFELMYDHRDYMRIIAVEPDSLLGNDVVFYSNVDTTASKIAVGISRKAGQEGVTGTGFAVRVKAVISNNAPNGTIIQFSLQNVVANDANGVFMQMALGSSSTTVLRTAFISESEPSLPADYRLEQNYPNPFNPSTRIEFALPRTVQVMLKIFNLNGQEVATLVDEQLPAGRYKANWDASSMQAGTYFYQLQAAGFMQTKKLTLIK